jgi:hypothetical protein
MTTKHPIEDYEDRRWKAMLEGDVPTLEQLWSEHLVYGHSAGARDSKCGMVDKIATRYMTFKSVDWKCEQIIDLGETVLIVGHMVADAHSATIGSRQMDNLYLAAWTKEDGDWKLAAFQPTPYQDHSEASKKVDAYIAEQKAKMLQA